MFLLCTFIYMLFHPFLLQYKQNPLIWSHLFFLTIKIVLHTSMFYLTYLEHNPLFYKLIKSFSPSNCHHSTEYLATADWMKKWNMFYLVYCNVCGYICYLKKSSKVSLNVFNMEVHGKYIEKCERMAKSLSHLIFSHQ